MIARARPLWAARRLLYALRCIGVQANRGLLTATQAAARATLAVQKYRRERTS